MSNSEQQMDFFKFMDETIKREEAKKKVVLPMGDNPDQPYNANREYQNRYAHRVYDRFWLGPRRY
jgi:hypothetical protein